MLEIRENVDTKDYCTFKVGGKCRYFITINNPNQIKEACSFSKEQGLPLRAIGSGSNMVFPDGTLENILIKIEIPGFEIINETDDFMDIKVGAGELWDSVVSRSVDMNLCGIEALSAIPGTAGSTPVQNVGAYGQEVKDTILDVEVIDLDDCSIKTISNKDCRFSYRDSIFKNESKNKYIITAVVFRLGKVKELSKSSLEKVLVSPSLTWPDHFQESFLKVISYSGVKKYLDDNLIANPTLLDIRNAIINIRKNKLPNPNKVPNVGSFFKNPIVNSELVNNLKKTHPEIPSFVVDENNTKIPAGWLIENAGLKGFNFGPVSTYQHNALVLVNNGSANRADVDNARDEIIKRVNDKFGIVLEAEPEFI